MDETKSKFQFAGLKFLYDMELIDDPQLINNMKLNVFDVSNFIRDVEFLSSYHHKSMLIWLDVSWLGKKLFEKSIVAGVTDRVQQLLPNFRFRVVTDRKIFDLSLEKVKIMMKGASHENAPRTIDGVVGSDGGATKRTEPSPSTESSYDGNSETESKG